MVNAINTRVERIMARRQIDALINADPVNVVFHRRVRVPVHGGGWKWGPDTPLTPQEVTLIPFVRRMTQFMVNTELGEVPNLAYILVGRHDLDILREDYFLHQGDKFEVKEIDFEEEVRVAAQITYYGETNG